MITFYLINGKELKFNISNITFKRNDEGDYIVITSNGSKRYDINKNSIAYIEHSREN